MTDQDTAVALLDAAEVAFAEHGVDAVSLRAIMRAAGVNTAAIHYHYGSRDELARAVLKRVLNPLQTRRLQLLDELVSSSEEPSISSKSLGILFMLTFPYLLSILNFLVS
jgi:AcrR family transcriptional regulator